MTKAVELMADDLGRMTMLYCKSLARSEELEAALRRLNDLGLRFEDTKTVTIALEPWREAMALLEPISPPPSP